MSAMPIGAPGCPEFAAWTASMLRALIAFARSRRAGWPAVAACCDIGPVFGHGGLLFGEVNRLREARIFPVIGGGIKGTMRHPFDWNPIES